MMLQMLSALAERPIGSVWSMKVSKRCFLLLQAIAAGPASSGGSAAALASQLQAQLQALTADRAGLAAQAEAAAAAHADLAQQVRHCVCCAYESVLAG